MELKMHEGRPHNKSIKDSTLTYWICACDWLAQIDAVARHFGKPTYLLKGGDVDMSSFVLQSFIVLDSIGMEIILKSLIVLDPSWIEFGCFMDKPY